MKRILLMGDGGVFGEIARDALRRAGYDVACAAAFAELGALRSQPSDLILMDVQMPEAYGDDLAMTLKFTHDIATPIYLLSSLDDSELADRASWARINGYISKNRGMDAIVAEVRRILAD